jgi:hypothetical protein
MEIDLIYRSMEPPREKKFTHHISPNSYHQGEAKLAAIEQ